ncbi:hypothetical protein D3C76_1620870 [compost metagenome]
MGIYDVFTGWKDDTNHAFRHFMEVGYLYSGNIVIEACTAQGYARFHPRPGLAGEFMLSAF